MKSASVDAREKIYEILECTIAYVTPREVQAIKEGLRENKFLYELEKYSHFSSHGNLTRMHFPYGVP